ncbi:MAG: hypothetical protein CMO80_01725 [Verrucomicrobiales bacterium]|nr:hypothetical protein [Verrucomicrobiales bacterium]
MGVEALTDSPWFDLIASVVMLASAIAAVTPTPKEGSILAKLYRLIDWAALNVGKAKDKGAG